LQHSELALDLLLRFATDEVTHTPSKRDAFDDDIAARVGADVSRGREAAIAVSVQATGGHPCALVSRPRGLRRGVPTHCAPPLACQSTGAWTLTGLQTPSVMVNATSHLDLTSQFASASAANHKDLVLAVDAIYDEVTVNGSRLPTGGDIQLAITGRRTRMTPGGRQDRQLRGRCDAHVRRRSGIARGLNCLAEPS
jgi:hypothetical protein